MTDNIQSSSIRETEKSPSSTKEPTTWTYAFVMANVLCFPDESRQTLALTTFSPRFFNAFIWNTFANQDQNWQQIALNTWIIRVTDSYRVEKCPKAIPKGNLYNRCFWIWIQINYNFGCWNCSSLLWTSILLDQLLHESKTNISISDQKLNSKEQLLKPANMLKIPPQL